VLGEQVSVERGANITLLTQNTQEVQKVPALPVPQHPPLLCARQRRQRRARQRRPRRAVHAALTASVLARARQHSPASPCAPGPLPAQAWGADAAYDLHRGSLVAYSALRDPADGYVRVFLDAEPFLAPMLTCHFQARRGRPGALYWQPYTG